MRAHRPLVCDGKPAVKSPKLLKVGRIILIDCCCSLGGTDPLTVTQTCRNHIPIPVILSPETFGSKPTLLPYSHRLVVVALVLERVSALPR